MDILDMPQWKARDWISVFAHHLVERTSDRPLRLVDIYPGGGPCKAMAKRGEIWPLIASIGGSRESGITLCLEGSEEELRLAHDDAVTVQFA